MANVGATLMRYSYDSGRSHSFSTQSEIMKPAFIEKFVESTYSYWLVMTYSLILVNLLPPDNFKVY